MLFHDTVSRGGTQSTGNGSNKRTGSAGEAANCSSVDVVPAIIIYLRFTPTASSL